MVLLVLAVFRSVEVVGSFLGACGGLAGGLALGDFCDDCVAVEKLSSDGAAVEDPDLSNDRVGVWTLLSDDAGEAPLLALAGEAVVCDPEGDDMAAEKRMPYDAL